MFLLNIIFIPLIILVIIIANINIMKISLHLTVGFNYENRLLILPAIITTIFWAIILLTYRVAITHFFNITLFEFITNIVVSNLPPITILPMILISIGFIILGILTQALSYMSINLNTKDTLGIAHLTPNNILNYNENTVPNNYETSISNYYNVPKIYLSDALIASLCTFTGLFFIIGILLFVGIKIGKSII